MEPPWKPHETEVERRKSSGQRRVWSFSALRNRCAARWHDRCFSKIKHFMQIWRMTNIYCRNTYDYRCMYIRGSSIGLDVTWCYLVSWHGVFLIWGDQMPNAKGVQDGTFYWTNINKIWWILILDGLSEWRTDCKDSAMISEGCNKETIVGRNYCSELTSLLATVLSFVQMTEKYRKSNLHGLVLLDLGNLRRGQQAQLFRLRWKLQKRPFPVPSWSLMSVVQRKFQRVSYWLKHRCCHILYHLIWLMFTTNGFFHCFLCKTQHLLPCKS